MGLGKYAFVVLSDVGGMPGDFENALREYVRGGGIGADRAGPAGGGADQGAGLRRSDPRERATRAAKGERFQTAAWLDTAHPSVGKDERVGRREVLPGDSVAPGKARVVAKLSDQTPLLMDQQLGEGPCPGLRLHVRQIANDFPLHASFVPFIEQTARVSGPAGQPAGELHGGLVSGTARRQGTGAAVDVLDPKGERALSLEEATKAQSIRLAQRGLLRNPPAERQATNWWQ